MPKTPKFNSLDELFDTTPKRWTSFRKVEIFRISSGRLGGKPTYFMHQDDAPLGKMDASNTADLKAHIRWLMDERGYVAQDGRLVKP